jgi:hypothetical protein
MARIKSPDERGRVGAWAYTARMDADLSGDQVVEQLARRGVRVHPATIRGIEGGTKSASRRLIRELASIYKVDPPTEAPPISEGGGDAATLLAAFRDALLEQTRALAEVRLELREARRTAEEERGVIAEILARLEARLELGTEPASNGAGDAGPALRHA